MSDRFLQRRVRQVGTDQHLTRVPVLNVTRQVLGIAEAIEVETPPPRESLDRSEVLFVSYLPHLWSNPDDARRGVSEFEVPDDEVEDCGGEFALVPADMGIRLLSEPVLPFYGVEV